MARSGWCWSSAIRRVGHLRRRFRDAEVIAGDARDLPQLLAANGIGRVPRILSGLPLRSMPPPLRLRSPSNGRCARTRRQDGPVHLSRRAAAPAAVGGGGAGRRPARRFRRPQRSASLYLGLWQARGNGCPGRLSPPVRRLTWAQPAAYIAPAGRRSSGAE